MFTLTAHRGAAQEAPENSVRAFRGAIAQGADELELDIQATRDGHLIVFHDQSVERMTDGRGPVADYTLTELQGLVLHEGEVAPPSGAEDHIPTFAEVLEAVEGFPLQVEIKSRSAVPLLASILEEQPHRVDQFWVNTGDVEALTLMRRACPRARLAHSVDHASVELVDRAIELGCGAVFLAWPGLTQDVVDYAHEKGLLITSWMANDREAVDRAFALGLDGLTTDDVPGVLPHVQRWRSQRFEHSGPRECGEAV